MGLPLFKIQVLQDNVATVTRTIAPAIVRDSIEANVEKYMGVSTFWLADNLARGEGHVVWCPSDQNLADCLTKQSGYSTFPHLCAGIRDVRLLTEQFKGLLEPAQSRGCVEDSILHLPDPLPSEGFPVGEMIEGGAERHIALRSLPLP